jgi:outer membrane immunogenic protein
MKRLILGVAAALVLSAGPAAADGLPTRGSVKDPVVAVPTGPNWNGISLGVGIGAGAIVTDLGVDVYRHDEYEGGIGFDGFGGEGVFGVVTIGYDRVIRPGWVGGIFADYDFGSNISTDLSISGYGSGSLGLIDHNYSWAVGGRLGFLTSPSTLVYGTAGYTQADFDYIDGHLSETFDGYFVGAGIETFLRDNWTLKLEYRFAQLDEETIFEFEKRCETLTFDLEPSIHSARLVLSYKFGH